MRITYNKIHQCMPNIYPCRSGCIYKAKTATPAAMTRPAKLVATVPAALVVAAGADGAVVVAAAVLVAATVTVGEAKVASEVGMVMGTVGWMTLLLPTGQPLEAAPVLSAPTEVADHDREEVVEP